jgi:hypothetical protein
MLPEINVYASTMKRMKQVWGYPKVGKEEKWDEPGLKKGKFGFYLNDDKKRALVVEMRYIITNHYLRIGSRTLLSELSTFEEDFTDHGNPTYNGARGSHDDRVISLGLALMAVKQSPKLSRLLLGNRQDKLPTAEELGLTTAPLQALVPNAHLDDEFADNPWAELDPALTRALEIFGAPRTPQLVYPSNPIEGR